MDECDKQAGVIQLQEYQSCTTRRLNQTQLETLQRHFSKYLAVQPTWQAGVCQLTAKSYVGTIVLEDIRIVIRPKVPLDNLFYMLTFAYDLPQFRREEAPLSVSENLFEFVVAIFVKRVAQLVRAGLYRSYVDLEENQKYLRGRLLVAHHLQQNAVHAHRFFQRTNEHTGDILENRILKYALYVLSRLDYEDPLLTHYLRRAYSAFQDVNLTPVRPADCDRVVFTRLNGRYRSPIHLAKLLLQNLSVEGNPGETLFAAFMLDMNQVFELFVARYLLHYFAEDLVLDVGIQDDIWLDAEQKEKGIPDVLLYEYGRPYLVLDTKYKEFEKQPSSEDRNQMLVYCHTLKLKRGMLVYANADPITYGRHFSDHTLLLAKGLPLHGSLSQFRTRCKAFAWHLRHDQQV